MSSVESICLIYGNSAEIKTKRKNQIGEGQLQQYYLWLATVVHNNTHHA